jgi:hypothetical protein
VKYRYYLAIVPILTGIIIFCSLFRLAGHGDENGGDDDDDVSLQ